MSATLGALVIAVATEFSVILAARYHEERGRASASARRCGRPTRGPGRRCSPPGSRRSPASASSPSAGSRCCATSGSSRSSTSTVALAGVMLVLPAALVWAEQGFHPLPARSPLRSARSRSRRRAPTPPPERWRTATIADGGGWWPARTRTSRRPARSGRSRARAGRRRAASRARDRPRPSGRYSMFVGLAFVALIVVALLNLLGDDDDRDPRARTAAGMPLAELRGARRARRRSTPTPTSPRTTARARATPAPRTSARTPACEIDDRGGDPGLRPLRPAARDLVLVHARRRLPAHPGRLRRGRRPLRGPRQLPQRQRPRRPGDGRRDRPRPRLDGPGRPRPRRRRLEPLPRRRLPDDRPRLSRRASSTTPRSARATTTPPSSTGLVEDLLDGDARARGARSAEMAAGRRAAARRARRRRSRRSPTSFPGLYLRWLEVARGSGTQPAGAEAAARGAVGPLRRAAGDRVPDEADPLGLPRLLPPHRARSRRAADAAGGGRARADAEGRVRQPQPASTTR